MGLKNRGRKGFILDVKIIEQLERMSAETDIPESRLVEKALMTTYGFIKGEA